jgi:hypothetical protein
MYPAHLNLSSIHAERRASDMAGFDDCMNDGITAGAFKSRSICLVRLPKYMLCRGGKQKVEGVMLMLVILADAGRCLC